jgi:2-keto-3-deoxy-6-phosphogluconate aldolase
MIGCGTVMDVKDARAAIDAGAQFIIAPILVPEVVAWCAIRNIVVCPGTQTPTEAYAAFKAGAPIQKIFPGVANGQMWIKAVSAALPMLSLMPTSGVDLDNAGDYLAAGAFGVGLVVSARATHTQRDAQRSARACPVRSRSGLLTICASPSPVRTPSRIESHRPDPLRRRSSRPTRLRRATGMLSTPTPRR